MPALPEILAPAGDPAALSAALAAGADAVYFGLEEGLNARARAHNFALAELPATCDQIHLAGARAFLTLNTLVFEEELPFLENLIRQAAAAGIDALIVQDPAVALLARAIAPTLSVHASTQMTISSAEAAHFAEGLGCSRVVLPRELSMKEICHFVQNTCLETEVFIHGALCMSWSGQCLTSEAWGGRSANRGQCAQSCRLPYTLMVDGKARPYQDISYFLSPLDQTAFRSLPALVQAGVRSLKIEGRMKGPSYVMNTVSSYKRWLQAIEAGQNLENDPRAPQELARMGLAYSRGFSNGFFEGPDHQRLVEGRFPKHRGLLVGEVVEVGPRGIRVQRQERPGGLDGSLPPLVPGMGLGVDTGNPEAEEPGGPLYAVETTSDGWWLRFARDNRSIQRVQPGHRIWLSRDSRLEAEAEQLAAPEGRVPVEVEVWGRVGQPLRVRFRCNHIDVEGLSELLLQPAAQGGLGPELLREKLCAFGGSPFRMASLQHEGLDPGLHLPVSALKQLRRSLLPQLQERFLASFRHAPAPAPVLPRLRPALSASAEGQEKLELVPLCRKMEQLEAVIAAGFSYVELDWMELVGLGQAVDRARAAGLRVGIATVRVHKPGEDAFDRRIAALKPDAVLVRHWAGLLHFARLPERPLIHGDFSLNICNSISAHHLLKQGMDSLTAAHDLDEAQLHALLGRFPASRMTVVAHHHISTFHTEHCVYAHTLSTGRDWKSCGRPCEQHQLALRDPVGLEHPVVVDVGCRNTVFEARAQSAARILPRLVQAGIRRFRLEFVWESHAQTLQVLQGYQALLQGRIGPSELLKSISAQEKFGVTAGTMKTMGASP